MKPKLTFITLIGIIIMTGCTKNNPENSIYPLSKKDTAFNTEHYYWAGNKKIIVQPQPEKSFIIFNEKDRYDIINADKMDYHVFKTAKIPDGKMFKTGLTRVTDIENAAWAIGTTRAFSFDENKILYQSQAYKNSKGTDIFVSHIFYVKLKAEEDYSALQRMSKENGVDIIGKFGKYMDLWYKLACSSESDCDALTMSARFYESGLFQYSEPDIMFEVRSCSKQPNSYPEYQAQTRTSDILTPNDPLFSKQWHLNNPGGLDINYLEAKAITQGSSDITVMIVDVEYITDNHPDLPELLYNYQGDVQAGDVHGTHCAGVIGAKTDNNTGIAGIAPDCKLMYSWLNQPISRPDIDRYLEIYKALIIGVGKADVISCSWEIYPSDIEIFEYGAMLNELFFKIQRQGREHWVPVYDKEMGSVIIFAAGNKSPNEKEKTNYLAKLATLSAGAMLKNGNKHNESNYGDIYAPGENIHTTTTLSESSAAPYSFPPQTVYCDYFSHTSAACPQVAAVAALILSVDPSLESEKVGGYIISNAKELDTGIRLLDAGAAVRAVSDKLK